MVCESIKLSNKLKIGALVLAAGYSSRMGEFKPLLEVGGKSLLEHAISLFRNTEAEEIVTVVGHRAEELIPVIKRAGSRYMVNRNYQEGMFSSIQKGVLELQGRCDIFFLLPVDIPGVRSRTLRQLKDAFNSKPSSLVCYPEFHSRRGHPPLIAASLIGDILSYTGEGGMRGVLTRYDEQAVHVPVTDPFVRLDVDTKADLFRLHIEMENYTTGRMAP